MNKLPVGWSDTQVALISRLYYLSAATVEMLLSSKKGINAYEKLLVQRLSHLSPAQVEFLLAELSSMNLVVKKKELWVLTIQGESAAYNLCELDIQEQSYLWGYIYTLFSAHASFKSMLDIGCAGGMSVLPATDAGVLSAKSFYLGIDIDQHNLQSGLSLLKSLQQNSLPSVNLLKASAFSLPVTDGAIECVISRATLYYLPKQKILAEITRVLCDNGYLIISLPSLSYMAGRSWNGLCSFNFRLFFKYGMAVILGVFAWLGMDIDPPQGLFIGETKRSICSQIGKVADLHLIHIDYITLPYLGRPLLLVVKKVKKK